MNNSAMNNESRLGSHEAVRADQQIDMSESEMKGGLMNSTMLKSNYTSPFKDVVSSAGINLSNKTNQGSADGVSPMNLPSSGTQPQAKQDNPNANMGISLSIPDTRANKGKGASKGVRRLNSSNGEVGHYG